MKKASFQGIRYPVRNATRHVLLEIRYKCESLRMKIDPFETAIETSASSVLVASRRIPCPVRRPSQRHPRSKNRSDRRRRSGGIAPASRRCRAETDRESRLPDDLAGRTQRGRAPVHRNARTRDRLRRSASVTRGCFSRWSDRRWRGGTVRLDDFTSALDVVGKYAQRRGSEFDGTVRVVACLRAQGHWCRSRRR
jgi:hypothetical protein